MTNAVEKYSPTEVNSTVLKSHLCEIKRPRVIHLLDTPSPRTDNGILDRPCVSTEAKQPLSNDPRWCSVCCVNGSRTRALKTISWTSLCFWALACLSDAKHRCFVLPSRFPTLLLQWPRSCPLQVAPPRSLPNVSTKPASVLIITPPTGRLHSLRLLQFTGSATGLVFVQKWLPLFSLLF